MTVSHRVFRQILQNRLMRCFAPMARHTVILRGYSHRLPDQTADNGCQRIPGKYARHGQVARKVAEHVGAITPAIMPPMTGPNSMPIDALHRKPKPIRRLGGSLIDRPSRSSVTLIAMSSA